MHRMGDNSKRKRFVEAAKLNQFDTKTQKLLEEIDKAQNALEEIQQKTLDEIISLEQRNSELRKPWNERRTAYIAQIPNFWATTVSFNIKIKKHQIFCLAQYSISSFKNWISNFKCNDFFILLYQGFYSVSTQFF